MPEGHSIHRVARQFEANFAGHIVRASSPQGRFAEGAEKLDGRTMLRTFAVGKQMFSELEDDLWLRVHLGIYGAWDFAGQVSTTLGQTGEYSRPSSAPVKGTDADAGASVAAASGGATGEVGDIGARARVHDSRGETSLSSIGAPRRARMRMAEQESATTDLSEWPPEPVGAVRLRLLTDATCADLRGPTACEVLDPAHVDAQLARLGPDPLVDRGKNGEARFVEAVRKRRTPVGILLMDQSVVAGIGNIYRAEMLYRARLSPFQPGSALTEEQARQLWRDWTKLLKIGVEVGQMMTIDGLRGTAKENALRNREDRHWVYGRAGLPCRTCGTPIALAEMQGRKLYWCPGCQPD